MNPDIDIKPIRIFNRWVGGIAIVAFALAVSACLCYPDEAVAVLALIGIWAGVSKLRPLESDLHEELAGNFERVPTPRRAAFVHTWDFLKHVLAWEFVKGIFHHAANKGAEERR